jgi:hypothetical protein
VKTSEIYWGAVPFVVIQVLMVATIIVFPKMVTGNISAAPGAIKGSGYEELQRQIIGAPAAPKAGDAQKAQQKNEDQADELEKALRGE